MVDVISTASNFDDSQIALMDKAFLLEAGDAIVIDQFIDYKRDINAKSIDLTKFAKLAKATTPLTDGVDPDRVGVTDTKITVTPAEYGLAVGRTSLASLQTGGKADLGVSAVVALNMAETLNAVGIIAGEAGTNILIANSVATEGALTATDLITKGDLNYIHNRLSRANILKFEGDMYVALCHPDVASDIKELEDFKDAHTYGNNITLIKNELGSYKGFRWVESSGVTTNTDAGSGTVDTYHTQFMGRNAMGRGVSKDPTLVISGPFDSLGRILNIGWLATLQYKIVDQNAHWIITSASSYGSN
jgi:N4-gp56 family major capsid protein